MRVMVGGRRFARGAEGGAPLAAERFQDGKVVLQQPHRRHPARLPRYPRAAALSPFVPPPAGGVGDPLLPHDEPFGGAASEMT